MYILGISAFYHDSAACLIKDGEVIAAAQEERFSRIKNDAAFPMLSIRYCLDFAGVKLTEVDYVVYYEKPFLKFERLLESYLSTAPKGMLSFIKAIPIWIREKIFQKSMINTQLAQVCSSWNRKNKKMLFAGHHQSHAASAFFPSPYQKALVICIDGVGEWTTSSVWMGEGNNLTLKNEMLFPHSLGLLYSTFTAYLGFKVNSDEYKVMGLAPYGEPKYAELILSKIIDLKFDGSFKLKMEYFDFISGTSMFNENFCRLFGQKPRSANTEIQQFHMDVAASIQKVTEMIVVKMVDYFAGKYQVYDLCLAGGVALNCVANGKILSESKIKRLWVQPAAGDAGGALGAALSACHQHLEKPRNIASHQQDKMKLALLGPAYSKQEVDEALIKNNLKFLAYNDEDFLDEVATHIQNGKVIGWFMGRMEYGPRALGSRSILGDCRKQEMQHHINLKVKFRESFRPFAPAILLGKVQEFYELPQASPYMLLVAQSKHIPAGNKPDKTGFLMLKDVKTPLPAVTHVDYSSRIQTVSEENGAFFNLITVFNKLTGCPAIVNTSFNIKDEPIVCSPQDAIECFLKTDIDVLAIEGRIVLKDIF